MARIRSLQTLRSPLQPNVTFVELTDTDGVSGLGETFFTPGPVESYLHDNVAPVLFGIEEPTPERVAAELRPLVGFGSGGVEVRSLGAIDFACWDLLGKRLDVPAVTLLGGQVHDRVLVYNTCSGSGYMATTSRQETSNWGLGHGAAYEDLDAFMTQPGELATSLVGQGIAGMKVWPFDPGAERTRGTDIRPADLEFGVDCLRQIRDAVGDDIEIMVELHGMWTRTGARHIIDAITPYRPYWVEDPIRPDAVDGLAALRRDIEVPIATGETLTGRRAFKPLLEAQALDIVITDVQWTGGLTEARKIASLADTYAVGLAPHDCTGPVSLAACVALVASQPNGLIQETVRAFLYGWYAELVEGLPEIVDGHISPTSEPGLGVRLRPGLADADGVTVRTTTAA